VQERRSPRQASLLASPPPLFGSPLASGGMSRENPICGALDDANCPIRDGLRDGGTTRL
jgi:hypothetical protein